MGLVAVGLSITVWVICGIVNYGLTLAWWYKTFLPLSKECLKADRIDAMWSSLSGPIGLTATLITGQCDCGFKWW